MDIGEADLDPNRNQDVDEYLELPLSLVPVTSNHCTFLLI